MLIKKRRRQNRTSLATWIFVGLLIAAVAAAMVYIATAPAGDNAVRMYESTH